MTSKRRIAGRTLTIITCFQVVLLSLGLREPGGAVVMGPLSKRGQHMFRPDSESNQETLTWSLHNSLWTQPKFTYIGDPVRSHKAVAFLVICSASQPNNGSRQMVGGH